MNAVAALLSAVLGAVFAVLVLFSSVVAVAALVVLRAVVRLCGALTKTGTPRPAVDPAPYRATTSTRAA
ncbi:hypothetical protein ACQEVB_24275 [Pseudonocardia sp. CA-107938]|uniref:hypothetical protein n=1 Tax=Pseudonocardia sp. CA-107938 TaxID=3240021 RepID=UPI003D902AD6